MPPKKLTHREKQQKEVRQRLGKYAVELSKIKNALNTSDDLETWRWASLEVFRAISNDKWPKNNDHDGYDISANVERMKERALEIARDAQVGINFMR